jgi:DNA repair exonuclease SbcCD ATPase subunit
MSPSEYQELVEFLTGQFAQADRRVHDLTLEMSRRLTAVDGRIASFRAEVDERFREVSGHFDEIYRRLERLEQEYQAISQQLRRMETTLTGDIERPARLERELAHLRERVNVMQAQLDDIERRLRT